MIVKAPQDWTKAMGNHRIFLAGSIEMGKAEKWQDKVCKALDCSEVILLNPRRDDWDSSWKQEASDPQFSQQVKWELNAQENADMILMYFDPATQSPITLLELGLFKDKRLVVCCPEGFFRKGNVDIVCQTYGIDQVATLDELIDTAKKVLSLYSPLAQR